MNDSCFPAIRQLARYEVWCNARVFDAAATLAQPQLFQPFPFWFHVVEVFQLWSGCVGPTIEKPAVVPYDAKMPLAQLARWNGALSDAFLAAVDASHEAGLLHRDRRINQLFHLVTHGTHHRTQFITMLRLLGIDPPFEPGDFGGWSNPDK